MVQVSGSYRKQLRLACVTNLRLIAISWKPFGLHTSTIALALWEPCTWP